MSEEANAAAEERGDESGRPAVTAPKAGVSSGSERVLEARKRHNAKDGKSAAKIALVCAIVGFVLFPIVLGPIAVVQGIIALKKLKVAESPDGGGLAIAAIALGSIVFAFGVLVKVLSLQLMTAG